MHSLEKSKTKDDSGATVTTQKMLTLCSTDADNIDSYWTANGFTTILNKVVAFWLKMRKTIGWSQHVDNINVSSERLVTLSVVKDVLTDYYLVKTPKFCINPNSFYSHAKLITNVCAKLFAYMTRHVFHLSLWQVNEQKYNSQVI